MSGLVWPCLALYGPTVLSSLGYFGIVWYSLVWFGISVRLRPDNSTTGYHTEGGVACLSVSPIVVPGSEGSLVNERTKNSELSFTYT